VVPHSYDDYKGLRNTDPFVFGGFFYANCRQHKNGKRTPLCSLGRGSVILFGSSVCGKFVLDTAFVVQDYKDYNCTAYPSALRDCVPPAYADVVLKPLCQSGCSHEQGRPPDDDAPYRLYIGATYDRPIHGMFSFFPRMPRHERCERFQRPEVKIHLRKFSSPPVAYRIKREVDKSELRGLWQSAVDQVLEAGLWLGIEAQTPERRRAQG
jgi:hypothetical protein